MFCLLSFLSDSMSPLCYKHHLDPLKLNDCLNDHRGDKRELGMPLHMDAYSFVEFVEVISILYFHSKR